MLILIITLLFEGIIPISCSCGEKESRKEPKDPSVLAYEKKCQQEAKEQRERRENFELLLERATLRAEGVAEEDIDKFYPLPGSKSKSNIDAADLPTKAKEIEEGGNAETSGGSGGGGYGY